MKRCTRDAEILRRLDADPTLSMHALGQEAGLSRERIRQIWRLAHPGESRPHPSGPRPKHRDRDAEILRRLDADPNLSLRTLAEEVGIDRSRIGAIWRREHPGETRPPAPARANPNTARANPNTAGITRRLDADPDLSMTALAKELGVHGSTVSRAWQTQHPGEDRPRPAKPPVRQDKRD